MLLQTRLAETIDHRVFLPGHLDRLSLIMYGHVTVISMIPKTTFPCVYTSWPDKRPLIGLDNHSYLLAFIPMIYEQA